MVTPKGNVLVVRRDELTVPPDVPDRFIKHGKIIVPEIAKARSRQGEVLAVGPKVKEDIRKGDMVVITWHEGTRYTDKDMGEIELFLEPEILAVLGR
jgi:co-chaperonin GroES (HSP10)